MIEILYKIGLIFKRCTMFDNSNKLETHLGSVGIKKKYSAEKN